jgi:hypothetical protein
MRYLPGQKVYCTVIEPAEHGYLVSITSTREQAYLHTTWILEDGAEIQAQFICIRDRQILLGPLPQKKHLSNLNRACVVTWLIHLNRLSLSLLQTQIMPASNNSRPFSKNQERGRLSLVALMILSCGLAFNQSESECRSTPEKVRAAILWSPPELSKSAPGASELEVRISDKGSVLHPLLQVFSDKKAVFTCEPDGLVLASVYQLEDGNLATLWHTGCGGDADTHFIVFTYLHGKVHQVLDAVSGRGMSPEFVYQREGHLMGSPEPNGPWFQQRIIIAKTDWALPKGAAKTEPQPVTVDIYTWDRASSRYKIRKGIQWKRRLENL